MARTAPLKTAKPALLNAAPPPVGDMVSDALANLPEISQVTVQISNELVHLLSDQLYQSPLKAVEELIVNCYDAGASICKLSVPTVAQKTEGSAFLSVFDNGKGMTAEGMTDLWHIGRSNKRTEEVEKLSARKQIGKFGIGKLATYTIAHRLTYISKTSDGILTATLNFDSFAPDATGARSKPVQIPVRKIDNWESFSVSPSVAKVIESSSLTASDFKSKSWTIALVEELKPKASQITIGRLKWVLSTAMPMGAYFKLFLNKEEVASPKDSYENAVQFPVSDLPIERINALNKKTGDNFVIKGSRIHSDTLPEGVLGNVRVTIRTLPGKSDDLLRSHGFFVRVRGRLITMKTNLSLE